MRFYLVWFSLVNTMVSVSLRFPCKLCSFTSSWRKDCIW